MIPGLVLVAQAAPYESGDTTFIGITGDQIGADVHNLDQGDGGDGRISAAYDVDELICVTVQRGAFGEVADGYIWSTRPGVSGNNSRLYTGIVGINEKRSLIRFGLDFLPHGAVVQSATLGIWEYASGSGETVAIYRITAPWNEGEPTWGNFASNYDDSIEWGSFVADGPGLITATVTELVSAWTDGAEPNYGLLLKSSAGQASDRYRSSESTAVAEHPRLEVCYVVGGVNDDPIAVDDEATTDEGTLVDINVLANDSDPDGDPLIVSDYDTSSTQGGAVICTSGGMCTYTPPADFDGADTFTYTASDGNGGADTATVTVTVTEASFVFAVSETASPTSLPEPGGAVAFTVRVTNTSEVNSLTVITLTSSLHGDLNGRGGCSVPQMLPPGDFYQCSFGATISGNAGDSEMDMVTAMARDDEDNIVSDDDSVTVTLEDVLPGILVTKAADPTMVRAGDSVDFTIRVYNHSVEPVTLTGLDDTVFGDLMNECGLPVDIAVGDFVECVISCVISADHANTVTATAEDDEGNEVTGSADASVGIIASAIRVVEEASVATASVGEVIVYTCTVENIGNVALTDVMASDDRLGPISLNTTTLAPGEITIGSGTYLVDESDLPGPIVNTVTVTGTPPLGDEVTDTGTTTVHLEPVSVPMLNTVYLPIVMNGGAPPVPDTPPAPDLVVARIIVANNNVQVVVKNQGDVSVLSTESFWVDLYVNPDPVPTGVNQTWHSLCSEGIVWGVTASALPLEPGGTITLTVGDAYYWPDYSEVSWPLPTGTPVYVQVDSANADTTYGAVLEGHEIVGGIYNNIRGALVSTSISVATGEGSGEAELPVASCHLPPRP